MAIVDNRNISLEGRKIGVHPIVTIVLMIILLILLSVPTYHMTNGLGSVFAPSGGFLLYVGAIVAFATATAEPILVQSIYHNEGTSKHSKKDITGRASLCVYIVFVTAMGGWSHGINNGQTDIKANAHGIQTQAFKADLKAAENSYHSAMAKAKDRDKAALGAAFQKEKARIYRSYSIHASSAVTQASEASRIASTLLYCLFSFIVSILTVAYARFILKFSLSITEIPIIDYISKLGQDWTTGKAEGSNNIIDHGIGRKSQLRGDLPEPKIQLTNAKITGQQHSQYSAVKAQPEDTAPNRPQPEDTTMGAVSESEKASGERPPIKTGERGVKVDYSAAHYETLIRAVIIGEVNPTQKPLKAALVALNIKFVDDAARQKKAVEILNAMATEGVLIQNPDYGKSGQVVAKFLLNPKFLDKFEVREDAYWDYVTERLEAGKHVEMILGEDHSNRRPKGWIDYDERQLISAIKAPATTEKVAGGTITKSGLATAFIPDGFGAATDTVNEFDITTRCGACGNFNYDKIDTLIDKNLGVVCCAACSRKYVAKSHLAKDSNPLSNELLDKARAS